MIAGAVLALAPAASAMIPAQGPQSPRIAFDPRLLRTGDLVFRAGRGYRAEAVKLVSSSRLSHVGLVDVDRGGRVFVIHAAPPDGRDPGGVERVTLASFAADREATQVVAYRLTGLSPGAARDAVRFAELQAAERIPFDDSFDANDASRLYCSELVVRSLEEAGLHTRPHETRINLGMIAGRFITPADLLASYPHQPLSGAAGQGRGAERHRAMALARHDQTMRMRWVR